jgi:hypothetical protein
VNDKPAGFTGNAELDSFCPLPSIFTSDDAVISGGLHTLAQGTMDNTDGDGAHRCHVRDN